jgi:hypothetical protein
MFGMLRRFGRRHTGRVMGLGISRRIANYDVVAATGGNRLSGNSETASHDSKQQRSAQS